MTKIIMLQINLINLPVNFNLLETIYWCDNEVLN